MKKKIVLLAIVVIALFLTFVPPVQAKQESFKFPIPEWFTQAIQPFQNSIKSLISKVDNHEARITELEKKIVVLEEKIYNLEKQSHNHTTLLINPNIDGAIGPSEPIGVGLTNPTGIGITNPTIQLGLNCGSSDCQELLHLNN